MKDEKNGYSTSSRLSLNHRILFKCTPNISMFLSSSIKENSNFIAWLEF